MIQTKSPLLVEDLIDDENFDPSVYVGYIYMTTFLDLNRSYIGKKNFFHTNNVKLGKKELAALPVTRGKKPSKKKVLKSSDWKTYYGSSAEVKELLKIQPKDKIVRSVLKLCKSKKELTYYECKYLFQYGVLEDSTRWINDNILGKFYRTDFVNL
jgi:hypothetical protein